MSERLRSRFRPIGNFELLPPFTLEVLQHAERATRGHYRMLLNGGVGYSGRQEIIAAVVSYPSDSFSRADTREEIMQKLTSDMLDK